MKRILALFMTLIGFSTLGQAQAPKMDQETMEKYVLFSDYNREKNYAEAKAPLDWLLENHPDLRKGLYINGIKVYENLVESTEDQEEKAQLQDRTLELFDQRIQYFQEEPKVLNLKGYSAFRYWGTKADKQEELYDLYKKIVELNGQDTYNQNVGTYMYLLCKMKGKKDAIDDAKIVEEHEKLTKIIDYNLVKYRKEEKPVYIDAWEKTQEYIDSRLENCVTIDCGFINDQFVPKYLENTADTTLAKKILGLGAVGKCSREPFYKEVLEKLVETNPTPKRLKLLAALYKKEGNMDKYISLMMQALDMGGSNAEKADFYLELANQAAKKGQSGKAREYALQAQKLDPSKAAQVSNFIGMLYFHSGTICVTSDAQKAPVFNYVAYLAAYEMFQKAGNTSMMSKCQAYFPTAGSIHTLGMTGQIGSPIPVGCWIGGTTTLRKR